MRLKLRVEVAGPSQDHAPEKRRATLAPRDLTLENRADSGSQFWCTGFPGLVAVAELGTSLASLLTSEAKDVLGHLRL